MRLQHGEPLAEHIDFIGQRVRHRISGQLGTLLTRGIWYSTVKFDGEDGTSWVANDSVVRVEHIG